MSLVKKTFVKKRGMKTGGERAYIEKGRTQYGVGGDNKISANVMGDRRKKGGCTKETVSEKEAKTPLQREEKLILIALDGARKGKKKVGQKWGLLWLKQVKRGRATETAATNFHGGEKEAKKVSHF